jgi:hypothetical protein
MTNTSFTGHIITSFKYYDKADAYLSKLLAMDYPQESISIFMSEGTKERFNHSDLDKSTTIAESAGAGSIIGGGLGSIAGIVLGL